MLPVAKRALIIGLLGPALQALGFIWTGLHLLLNHWSEAFGPRHLMYEPGVLLIVIGFAVSVICIPAAMEVANASEEDVDIPVYAPDPVEGGGDGSFMRPGFERLARYSPGTQHPATGQDRQTQARG